MSNYETFSDCAEGPLKPGDVGIVTEVDKSYKLEFNGITCWYDEHALEPYDETNVVEAAEPVVEAV